MQGDNRKRHMMKIAPCSYRATVFHGVVKHQSDIRGKAREVSIAFFCIQLAFDGSEVHGVCDNL